MSDLISKPSKGSLEVARLLVTNSINNFEELLKEAMIKDQALSENSARILVIARIVDNCTNASGMLEALEEMYDTDLAYALVKKQSFTKDEEIVTHQELSNLLKKYGYDCGDWNAPYSPNKQSDLEYVNDLHVRATCKAITAITKAKEFTYAG